MVTRVVRLHFRSEEADTFLGIFESSKEAIRAYPGCRKMELLRDIHAASTFVTISHWDSAEDLERYRKSALFGSVWERVKPLFSARAEACTVEKMEL